MRANCMKLSKSHRLVCMLYRMFYCVVTIYLIRGSCGCRLVTISTTLKLSGIFVTDLSKQISCLETVHVNVIDLCISL